MFNDTEPNEFDDWVCVMQKGTEYEVQLAKNYLADMEIPVNVLSKRDSSYNLNVGDMALVYLYVPTEYEAEARKALAEVEMPDDLDNDQQE